MQHDVKVGTAKVVNPILLTLPFLGIWFFYYAERTVSPFLLLGKLGGLWLCFFILYILFCRIYDGFLISINRISEIVYSPGIGLCHFRFSPVCGDLLAEQGVLVNPLPLFGALVVQVLLSGLWAYYAHRWYFSKFPAKRTAVIYDVREGLERLVEEYGLEKKFKIQIAMNVQQALANKELLNRMETVFLSGIHSHDRNILLKYCVEKDINVYVIPRIGDVLMSGAHPMHMFHLPMLRVGRYHPSPVYLFLKRGFDILASGL